jgi:hypothetical protein
LIGQGEDTEFISFLNLADGTYFIQYRVGGNFGSAKAIKLSQEK